jgi:predicted dehydrogenase
LKIGVIGCGYWGPKLARNFHEMPETELAWVADFREDRLAHLQQLYPNVAITRDYREILRSDVDAVAIATPVWTHHSIAIDALETGKHVLVEKPLAATVREANEIAETAERRNLVAMAGHTFQYNPAVNVVRDLIAKNALGQIYYIHATRVNLGLFQPDINVLWDLAPHDVSILMHILGTAPQQTSAQGQVCVQKDRGLHDVVYMNLRFPDGVFANLRMSWLDPVKTRRITVVGSKKMLVYDDIADTKVVVYDRGAEVPPYSDTLEEFHVSYRHGPEEPIPCEWREPLRIECEAFVRWILNGQPAPSHARFGAKVVQILEAAQKSLLNGGSEEPIVYG